MKAPGKGSVFILSEEEQCGGCCCPTDTAWARLSSAPTEQPQLLLLPAECGGAWLGSFPLVTEAPEPFLSWTLVNPIINYPSDSLGLLLE